MYHPLEGTHGAASATQSQKPETNHTGPPESNHWAAGSNGPTEDQESPQSSPSPPPPRECHGKPWGFPGQPMPAPMQTHTHA